MERMANTLDFIKSCIISIFTFMIATMTPIGNVIYVILVVFTANFFAGLAADIHVENKSFDFKKAWKMVVEMLFFMALVFLIHSVGKSLGDEDIAITGVKWVSYVVLYFYTTNILRNAKGLFPKSEAIDFLYLILTTKIFDKIKQFIGIGNDENAK